MKQFFNKPYLLPTLISLVLLGVVSAWLSPAFDLFALAHDLRWLAVAALFLYCLFCWLCISLGRWGEVAWKRADYLWLGCVALALVVQVAGEGSLRWVATALLLVLALSLRAAKVKAEILLKTPRRQALWLIFNQRLEVPSEGRLDMKAQRAKVRLTQLLRDWRVGRLPLAHVRVGSGQASAQPSAVIDVKPRFSEPEFTYDFQDSLEATALGRWVLEQPVDTLYLFGEINSLLLAQLFRWGRDHNLEVIVDGGVTLLNEERAAA
ncbi:hypothetical protein [Pseudomonas eucalypticola]|uniref:Uncharacterized protein n=1 Tax=Pseudomonas eucalypticola TaxID=2599595 RepID=A0A7D5DAK0_9PSED|nr:hypothetical protein [Pseudomonas eucalypticola]QKZ06015.1 hypothetical protein HWQ56_20385 [Pseudomonas eucalypticola]